MNNIAALVEEKALILKRLENLYYGSIVESMKYMDEVIKQYKRIEEEKKEKMKQEESHSK